jgi:hypothetical protein
MKLEALLKEAIDDSATIDDISDRMDKLLGAAFGSILTVARQIDELRVELADKGVDVATEL